MTDSENRPKLDTLKVELPAPLLRKMSRCALQNIVDEVLAELELPSWIEPDGAHAVVYSDGLRDAIIQFVLPTYMRKGEGTHERVVAFKEIVDHAMDERKIAWEREHGTL